MTYYALFLILYRQKVQVIHSRKCQFHYNLFISWVCPFFGSLYILLVLGITFWILVVNFSIHFFCQKRHEASNFQSCLSKVTVYFTENLYKEKFMFSFAAFLIEMIHFVVGRFYNFQPLLTRTEVNIIEPTCAYCTVVSQASLSVRLSVCPSVCLSHF